MNTHEGKEKGAGGAPHAYVTKARKPGGPSGAALTALTQLLIVFGRDLMDPEVRVEQAAEDFVVNLNDFLGRYGNG